MSNRKLHFVKVLLAAVFLLTAQALWAQKVQYGGSAYVYVKDQKGNTRTLNVVVTAAYDTETYAKSALLKELNTQKKSGEEFDGSVSYNVQSWEMSSKKNYGGSASVKVKDDKGSTRSINVTVSCRYSNFSFAKLELLKELTYKKKYNENFVSAASYDLDTCD